MGPPHQEQLRRWSDRGFLLLLLLQTLLLLTSVVIWQLLRFRFRFVWAAGRATAEQAARRGYLNLGARGAGLQGIYRGPQGFPPPWPRALGQWQVMQPAQHLVCQPRAALAGGQPASCSLLPSPGSPGAVMVTVHELSSTATDGTPGLPNITRACTRTPSLTLFNSMRWPATGHTLMTHNVPVTSTTATSICWSAARPLATCGVRASNPMARMSAWFKQTHRTDLPSLASHNKKRPKRRAAAQTPEPPRRGLRMGVHQLSHLS